MLAIATVTLPPLLVIFLVIAACVVQVVLDLVSNRQQAMAEMIDRLD